MGSVRGQDMLEPDKEKIWTLFMSDPVTFIAAIVAVAVFIWWLRGFLEKKHRDAVDAQRALARDQLENSTKELETAKKDNQKLEEKLAQFIPIDPQLLSASPDHAPRGAFLPRPPRGRAPSFRPAGSA